MNKAKDVIKLFLMMLAVAGMFLCSYMNVSAASSSSKTSVVNGASVKRTASISTTIGKASTSSITGVICTVSGKIYYVNTSNNTTAAHSVSATDNGSASFTYRAGNYEAFYKMTGTHTAKIANSTFTETYKVSTN